jgi:hypothetical protein
VLAATHHQGTSWPKLKPRRTLWSAPPPAATRHSGGATLHFTWGGSRLSKEKKNDLEWRQKNAMLDRGTEQEAQKAHDHRVQTQHAKHSIQKKAMAHIRPASFIRKTENKGCHGKKEERTIERIPSPTQLFPLPPRTVPSKVPLYTKITQRIRYLHILRRNPTTQRLKRLYRLEAPAM